jgi:hypothetical protein
MKTYQLVINGVRRGGKEVTLKLKVHAEPKKRQHNWVLVWTDGKLCAFNGFQVWREGAGGRHVTLLKFASLINTVSSRMGKYESINVGQVVTVTVPDRNDYPADIRGKSFVGIVSDKVKYRLVVNFSYRRSTRSAFYRSRSLSFHIDNVKIN